MTFDFDKIREDPQTAYVVGVVLGFALGYMVARKPPKPLRPLFQAQPETRFIEVPCAECAEKKAAATITAEEAHLES